MKKELRIGDYVRVTERRTYQKYKAKFNEYGIEQTDTDLDYLSVDSVGIVIHFTKHDFTDVDLAFIVVNNRTYLVDARSIEIVSSPIEEMAELGWTQVHEGNIIVFEKGSGESIQSITYHRIKKSFRFEHINEIDYKLFDVLNKIKEMYNYVMV